ncbi:FtsK/SpoIIIE domain-containing protein [Stackebrandtia endophytica]|uniref:FtsK/SpoIIIE domain-containing protein n=1 Tax=Stackebrandtia endophytica TaxID=1496996 RepID=UPI0014768301|nr:FtsK/SpoIIIE domain-containing protein [Stackebrandtia endophytica]
MSWRTELDRASAAFREARSHLHRAEELLAAKETEIPPEDATADAQADLARQLGDRAATLAPGVLSADLVTLDSEVALRSHPGVGTIYVRVGTGLVTPDASFPVVVPMLGAGHLVIDADASDSRVSGLLQSILLRTVAAAPKVTVALADCVALGQTFTTAAPLIAGGLTGPTATDGPGLEQVLATAEAHVQSVQQARNDSLDVSSMPFLLVVIAGLPPQPSRTLKGRIAALAHAGPHGRVHLVLAGWRDDRHEPAPAIEHATYLSVAADDAAHRVSRIPVPVRLDPTPPPALSKQVYQGLARVHDRETKVVIGDLIPAAHWQESSVTGLSTVVGRDSRGEVTLSLDDATPHWLIGGRTGGGKTVFLLDVLYGLASRYSPRELSMYLLDFKEGVSFTEFTPSPRDASWIPQVRAVGVESDREYGNAVLVALRAELTRRATAMKQAGVTKLAELRRQEPHHPMPRIVAVIDEFHVLFAGNDRLARESAAHLEELARKGRSYGVHLILASQTISGVEALYDKRDSIFGQFPLRIALPGARHVLAPLNTSAEAIKLGQAVVNDSGGVPGFDRLIQFPDATADPALLTDLRQRLWRERESGSPAPTVFAGYAEQHLADDPRFHDLSTTKRPAAALLGRAVDLDISTVAVPMESIPGRNFAVVGTDPTGADVLHAAMTSLGRQHEPDDARFVLAPLIGPATPVVDEVVAELTAAGHDPRTVTAGELGELVSDLVEAPQPDRPMYLAVFGGDAAGPVWGPTGQRTFQQLLRHGPAKGVHLLGWWRGMRRFIEDVGGSTNREDVAGLMLLNVTGIEVATFVGDGSLTYQPRDNRALVLDRHNNSLRLCVPFRRADRADSEGSW